MGRHYAEVEGRSSAVATAMYEGILPRFSGDALPSTPAGVLVSLADKCAAEVLGAWCGEGGGRCRIDPGFTTDWLNCSSAPHQ